MNFQIQSEPYSESREQGIDDLPFLEQSRINNTYKKESRQLGVAQSEEADRQRTSRVKHKTNRRWDLLGGQMHQHPRDVPEAWLSSLNALYGLLQQSDDFKNSVWWLPFICQTVLKHWLTYKPSPLHSENKPFGFLWLTSGWDQSGKHLDGAASCYGSLPPGDQPQSPFLPCIHLTDPGGRWSQEVGALPITH